MGVIKQGIQGGFSGKVGPHVGSSWKGINVMRAMPTSVANPNTEAQQEQRSAFKQTSMLASAILTTIIKPYWDRSAVKMSGYNLFVKTNIANATKELGFDFSKLQMSVGRMEATEINEESGYRSTDIGIHWDPNHTPMYSSPLDQPVCVILDDNGNVIHAAKGNMKRTYDAIELTGLEDEYTSVIHAYLFFVSPDSKVISKTSYRKLTKA